MAEQPTEFSYHNIHIYKSEGLGSGSYGGVCKAKCDGLLCAAKIMHPTLFDLNDPGAASYLSKFHEECHLLSLARHPNVVQYLGTYTDPDTRLPVLLMEFCDESLTAFLERSPGPLSYHIQVNICHDIALALVYLHSNGLIHRDLTGKNVLLVSGPRAKITDFGMSKLASSIPYMTALTQCPGNSLYMSPEALDKAKSYTGKLDIFSFGVIIIQILTKLFPDPTDRFCTLPKELERLNENIDEEEGDRREVRQVVPERERRQAHIKLIPDTSTLKPIALECLKQKEKQRPSAVHLSERLYQLKQSSQYAESKHQALHSSDIKSEQIHAKIAELESIVAGMDREIQEKRSSLRKMAEQQLQVEFQQAKATEQRELHETQEQLRASEQLVSDFQNSLDQKDKTISDLKRTVLAQERRIQHLEKQDTASRADQPQQGPVTTPHTMVPTTGKDISMMRWREEKNAPEEMSRGAAIVHGNTAYFRPDNSYKVYSYNILEREQQWLQQPENPNINYGLAVIDGLLTSVGGLNQRQPTNVLLSLIGEGEVKQWSKIFLPMPTPRRSPACVTPGEMLIAIGGQGFEGFLSTVEVMNTTSKQWTTISPFPQPLALLSCVVCNNTLYLAGGLRDDYASSKSVFTCSVHDIIESVTQQKLSPSHNNMWEEICSLPVAYSTLAVFNGVVLAIGGEDDSRSPTSDIYKYEPNTDSWTVVSQIMNKRSFCFAITLPEILIVVGGDITKEGARTKKIEILE